MFWATALFAALLFQADPVADGRKALEQERWADAATAFSKATAAQPNEYTNHFHLALALSMLQRDNEAIAEYEKVLQLQPSLMQAEQNLGILLMRNKRSADAVPHLRKALAEKPGDVKRQMNLAAALLESGQSQEALSLYEKAPPGTAEVEFGLGRAYLKLNKPADAQTHLEKAASLDPGYSDGLLELAGWYEQNKNLPAAIAIYRRYPESPGVKERLGELLLETGQATDAIPQLEEAVRKDPTPANRYALATAYTLGKQYDKAEAQLSQALGAQPSDLQLRLSYARVLREQKKYPAAAGEFYKAAQLKPDSPQSWSDLAGVLILMNEDAKAIAALDRVRALGAETAAHYYFRALVFDRNKQYKEALAGYQRFLQLSNGKNADEEFKARQRVRVIEKELSKR